MLFTDHLSKEKAWEIRHLLHAENFGTSEVDIQSGGRVFLNGYFTLRELELLLDAAKCAAKKERQRH